MVNNLTINPYNFNLEQDWNVIFFSKNGQFKSTQEKLFVAQTQEENQLFYYYPSNLNDLLTLLKSQNPFTIVNIGTADYSTLELEDLLATLTNQQNSIPLYIILWTSANSNPINSKSINGHRFNDIRSDSELEANYNWVLQVSIKNQLSIIKQNTLNPPIKSRLRIIPNRISFRKKLKELVSPTNSKKNRISLNYIDYEKQRHEIELRNAELEKAFKKSSINHIKLQKILYQSELQKKELATVLNEIRQKNEELLAQNEEMTAQRDQIEQQNEEIQAQRDVALKQQEEIRDNLMYARRIQQALLPPADLINQLLPNHFILNRPKDIVSGDFYWISQNRFKTVIAVADCTGHGISGAMMSMLGTAFLNEIINKNDITNSSQILEQLRERVITSLHQEISNNIEYSRDGMDIAVCIIDIVDNTLEYSGANNSLYLIRENELIELKADKMPIGIHEFGSIPFTTHKIELKSGDSIYIFSDGFPDQFGGNNGKKLKYSKFKEILQSLEFVDIDKREVALNQFFNAWKGDLEQIDDVLVVGFKIA
ncbi:MAG: SpoIIE family protein phosphatase [Salinivirgaceae bacterium]